MRSAPLNPEAEHLSDKVHLGVFVIKRIQSAHLSSLTRRVLSVYIAECGVSTIGIASMVWASFPHIGTLDPLGNPRRANQRKSI